MTTTVDFFTTITVTNEHDIQVPRYTNPRAVIDLDTYRRYTTNNGEVDVAVLGNKTNHDPADPHAGVTPDGVERIFDGLIPDVHMEDNLAGILGAAVEVLAGQGFTLAATWVRDGNTFTADLKPTASCQGGQWCRCPQSTPCRAEPAECAWFLECHNAATMTKHHPILGGVSTCTECSALVHVPAGYAR